MVLLVKGEILDIMNFFVKEKNKNNKCLSVLKSMVANRKMLKVISARGRVELNKLSDESLV